MEVERSKIIKELNPDTLISDGALLIPCINGLKILKIHDVSKGLRVLNVKFLIKRYDYMVVSSEIIRGEFICKFNVGRNKCITIPPAIDMHKYKPN